MPKSQIKGFMAVNNHKVKKTGKKAQSQKKIIKTGNKNRAQESIKSAGKKKISARASIPKRRASNEGQIMISVNNATEAAMSSISGWWNAELHTWSIRDQINDLKEKIRNNAVRSVDGVHAPPRITSQAIERAVLWLLFGLLTIAVLIAVFAAIFSIIKLLI